MITEKDITLIRDSILKTIPPAERETATAAINVGLHVLNQFERIANAFEQIAHAQSVMAGPQSKA